MLLVYRVTVSGWYQRAVHANNRAACGHVRPRRFRFRSWSTKYDNVRKASKHHPADVECELRKLLRSLLNALQRGAKFGHQSTRCVRAALPIPFNSGFGFVLRLRVNPDRLHLEGTLAQSRRSASSQGIIATAPVSISRKRFWISSSQACSTPSSTS